MTRIQSGGRAMNSAGTVARFFSLAVLGSAVLLHATGGANAQNGFTGIQAFGDSYADTGNLFRIVGPSIFYPTGRFSGGTNFVDTTSSLLGIPQTNYAIGGAKTGTTNTVGVGIPGFAQE